MKGENRAKRELRLQEVQAIRAECYLGRSLPYVQTIAAPVLEFYSRSTIAAKIDRPPKNHRFFADQSHQCHLGRTS